MKLKALLKDRFFIISALFFLFGVLFIFRLADLQIVNGESYINLSINRLMSSWNIPAPRGKVMDRNGVVIAENREGFNIQISRASLSNEELNASLYKLINLFEKNGDSYLQSFSKVISFQPFDFGTRIKSRAEYAKLAELESKLPTFIKTEDAFKDIASPQELYNYLYSRRSEFKNIDLNKSHYEATYLEKIDALKKFIKREIILTKKEEAALENLNSLSSIYDLLKNDVYEISSSYSPSMANKILSMRYEIRLCRKTKPVPVANDVNKVTLLEIEERQKEFPGVTSYTQPFRKYNNPQLLSHILGYVGRIDDTELEKFAGKGYNNNDLIGKMGVERDQESVLKGVDGTRFLEINQSGRFASDINSKAAIPGNDVQLTLDMRLQKVAAEALAKRIKEIRTKQNGTNITSNYGDASAGAVVAIDVQNGEILAMASYPTYNPDDFLNSSKSKTAQANITKYFSDNKGSPMTNRAIYQPYAPGSTYKPLLGIAAIEEGLISPNTKIYDGGFMYIDKWELTCMEYRHGYGAHLWQNFSQALAASCNIFFHKLGVGDDTISLSGLGIVKINKWAKYYGLGEKTGIDIGTREERSGVLASPEYKLNYKGLEYKKWVALDTAYASIGQSFNEFTPIQLANYVGLLANGGYKYTPHLIRSVLSPSGKIISANKPTSTKLPVSIATVNAVKEGMVAVARDGTAANIFNDLPHKVAGKTGTAQTRSGDSVSNNGVFICYYPAEPELKPEIAVAVVIEHGVQGRLTANVAKEIFKEYIKNKKSAQISSIAEPITPSILP